MLAGKAFYYVMLFNAIIGQTVAVVASFIARSYLLVNLGGKSYLNFPFLTWKLPRLETPFVSIVIVGIVQIICIFIPFSVLVEILNVFYCLVMIVICLSYLNLKRLGYCDRVPHEYRASNNRVVVFLIALFPILISLMMICISVFRSYIPLLFAIITTILISFVYYFLSKHRSRTVQYIN